MSQNDKLRRLRDWIMARWPDAYTETAVDRRIVREIDRLLAEDEPETPQETPGDEVLREFLRYAKEGWHDGKLDEGLLAMQELCRRALGGAS